MAFLRIGICEDDAQELSLLLKALEECPFECETETFYCGEVFLQAFFPGRFDLILMDIYMEGMTGVETVARIRELDGEVPIAFLTTSKEHAMDGYRFRVDRYLVKPYSSQELLEVLDLAEKRMSMQPVVTVLVQGEHVEIPQSHICYADQDGRSCELHLLGGDVIRTVMKLTELEEMLPSPPFLRCHKSYLVHLGQIQGVNRELSMFEMKNGGNAYIRRASLRSAERAYQQYMFSLTRQQGGIS